MASWVSGVGTGINCSFQQECGKSVSRRASILGRHMFQESPHCGFLLSSANDNVYIDKIKRRDDLTDTCQCSGGAVVLRTARKEGWIRTLSEGS